MSKKVIIPSLVLGAIACTGFYGVGTTLASENETGRDTIIQKISERFNLNTDEVQEVFSENREERQAKMQEKQEERLAQAVSDGKLSEDQKELLLNKREENRTEREGNRETFRSMIHDERMELREEHREEMQQWMEDNGIDYEEFGGHGEGMRGGPGIGK